MIVESIMTVKGCEGQCGRIRAESGGNESRKLTASEECREEVKGDERKRVTGNIAETC